MGLPIRWIAYKFVVTLISANLLYPQKTKGQRGHIKQARKFDEQWQAKLFNNQKYFNLRGDMYTIQKPTTISDGMKLIRPTHKHDECVIMKGKGHKQIE